MNITLGTIADEKNKLNKTISNTVTFNGSLRHESSVINPKILIESENLSGYNYMHIPEFGRFYFISEIVSVRNGLWRVSGVVDVLMSFRNSINNCNVILSDSEINGTESYMNGEQWRTLVKSVTDVINFPNGLNETGEYILITSGGIAHGN